MSPRFTEVQRLADSRWVLVVVLAVAAVAWGSLAVTVASGPSASEVVVSALVAGLVGVALPWLLMAARLETTVWDDRIDLRYRPLRHRVIPSADVASAEVRTYRPMREYGGWGLKGWSTKKVAYNVRGDRGVDLTLRDGQRLLIGSQRAEELGRVIAALISPDPAR